MEPKKILTGPLPLQTETNVFILANVLDVYMTYLLLTRGAIEANPLANLVLSNWGFHAMVWFKLAMVAGVCVIAQLIATKKIGMARFVLIFGTSVVACVVAYSIRLYLVHFS